MRSRFERFRVRAFPNQDDSQSGIWLTVEGKWEYRLAHRFKLK